MNAVQTPASRIDFRLIACDPWSGARAGVFNTAHGPVETPIFMPVATSAALRAVDTVTADALGYQVLLANTYHLLLRPGPQVFEQFGGIHRFMDWPRAVLTDSGGYQIYSFSRQTRIAEEGAYFRSYIDGKHLLLSPEISIATQRAIGADIMMVLDHCVDSTSTEPIVEAALQLTERWATRCLAARGDSTQALFGIVQGACYPELRRRSAEQITAMPFDGFAIGGLAVGEGKSAREDMVELTAKLLPSNRPRYLMGVGTPIDLLEAVKRGVDMFDCILPTLFAQQGVCFTSGGKLDLRRGAFKHADSALDAACTCATCRRFSRAYLHHVVRAQEPISAHLLGLHNLTFYRELMIKMRNAIVAGTFKQFYTDSREPLAAIDGEQPIVRPKRRHLPSPSLGRYEVVKHLNGYGSIRHVDSGEVMHSVIDPAEEALALYVRQSGVLETALQPGEPLVIWDVGLGAATNAMTCILALENLAQLEREVRIISFENDLDSLNLALSCPTLFKHVRHAAPHQLLKEGEWRSRKRSITWELKAGDFWTVHASALSPHIVWYDPFSYKVDSEMWSVSAFARLESACAMQPAALYTYSASTAIRAAMLAAGWYVGAGTGSGPKQETTVAFNHQSVKLARPPSLLGASWLMRWSRSDARQPFGENDSAWCDRVRDHPQFAV